ncbi:two-component sensor histidine kinase [Arthrobacter sp. AQ5-06]|nr:two-component sensor histidine kinase [Arthrobacter sp. AQ5-06]
MVFRGKSLRGRVVMCQLPLSVTMVLVIILTEVFHPGVLRPGPFLYSLPAHLVLLAACALVPWERLPDRAFAVIPFLDCLAIGFSRDAADSYLTVLAYLLVFPVVWLSIGRQRSGVIIAVLGTVLSALLPPLVLGTGFTGPSLIRIVLLPIIVGAIAVTAHTVSKAVIRQRMDLERQEEDLQKLLTASEKRERLLNTVVDTVGVGVCALDEQGREILANRRHHAALVGTTSDGQKPPGDNDIPVYSMAGSRPLPTGQHPLQRAARGEPFADELLRIDSGAAQRAYSASCRLIKDGSGRPAGAVLALTDVTAMVSALAAKDQFVATVSHELRTPLTSILGYLGLALDEYPDLDADLVQYLTVAQRNAERLLKLVTDLLSIASDTLTINPGPTDLTDIITSRIEDAKPHANDAGITIQWDPTGPLPGVFDPARIGQALDNLLSNAIKYTADGGAVTVRARRNGNSLECQVADTGVGMNEEEQAQAFTRFFRAERSHTAAIPGAGLGLPITKTLIENHGGTIGLASSPGNGTTVTLTLPDPDPTPSTPPTTAVVTR